MKHELDTLPKQYRVVANGMTLRTGVDTIELQEFVNGLDYTIRAFAVIEPVPVLKEGIQLLVEKTDNSFI